MSKTAQRRLTSEKIKKRRNSIYQQGITDAKNGKPRCFTHPDFVAFYNAGYNTIKKKKKKSKLVVKPIVKDLIVVLICVGLIISIELVT